MMRDSIGLRSGGGLPMAKSGTISVYDIAGVRDPTVERDKWMAVLKKDPRNAKAKALYDYWSTKIKENNKMPPAWS
jgi:hypothetical protein